MGNELSPGRLRVWRQLSSRALEVIPAHSRESLVSSVAGKHNFQVQTLVGLIHPCSMLREREMHMGSETVACVGPVQVYAAGLYSNALVLIWGFIWCII